MNRLILTLTIVITLITTSQQGFAQPVVSGYTITSGADFFVALVQKSTPLTMMPCGASLIRPQWVLTAGHCYLPNLDVVISPYIITASGYQRISVSKMIVYPDYQGNEHDIALIKLATPVTGVTPIELAAQNDNSLTADGAACNIIGFGVSDTTAPNFGYPDTLQFAEIKVISNTKCGQLLGGGIPSSILCAGTLTGPSKGAGAGDSGGPLFVTTAGGPVQVGVVSGGLSEHTKPNEPGMYTKVSVYRKWIDSVINADAGLSVGSIEENKAELIRTDRSVTVKLETAAENDLSFALYNYEGRVISKGVFAKGKTAYTIDAPLLQNGMYFMTITDNMNYRFTGKLPVIY